MKPIGIIGAMEQEVSIIKENLDNEVQITKAGLCFHSGNIKDRPVVVVRCGIGKVNAAICAQILIDIFEVSAIVNVGVAGGLAGDLTVGDVVISDKLFYHDYDMNAFMKLPHFAADETLVNLASVSAKEMFGERVHLGGIISGDCFVDDSGLKTRLVRDYPVKCVEMEGAAIAHVCSLNGLPFVVIRGISDLADEEANTSFEDMWRPIAEKAASAVIHLVLRRQ